ncbi:MAG: RimK-like ATPgrasp N-terminal domain-containing protein, partial [Glaciecola sp.]
MITTLIVVDSLNDFPALELDATVLDFESYLADYPKLSERKTRVINLCNTNKYLSKGYYCSLLAEARHHKVLPSVNTINDLIIESTEQSLEVASLTLPKALSDSVKDSAVCDLVFGTANDDAMQAVAKYVFDRFPAPYLQISVSKQVNSTSLKVRLGNWDEVISQG